MKSEDEIKKGWIHFISIETRKSYPIDMIEPNSFNVNSMTPEEFEGLKESIQKTKGEFLKLYPIKIWHDKASDEYIIIDGEHRWRACKELGFKVIPAVIEDVSWEDVKRMNVIFNHFRRSN